MDQQITIQAIRYDGKVDEFKGISGWAERISWFVLYTPDRGTIVLPKTSWPTVKEA